MALAYRRYARWCHIDRHWVLLGYYWRGADIEWLRRARGSLRRNQLMDTSRVAAPQHGAGRLSYFRNVPAYPREPRRNAPASRGQRSAQKGRAHRLWRTAREMAAHSLDTATNVGAAAGS